MKKSSGISLFSKTLFFGLGLLVAVFVVSQEVIDYHCAKIAAEMQDEEQGEDDKSETEISLLAFDVLLPGSSITLEPFTPVLLREVVLEEEIETPIPQDVPLTNTPYFRTLFRQIISPNAP